MRQLATRLTLVTAFAFTVGMLAYSVVSYIAAALGRPL